MSRVLTRLAAVAGAALAVATISACATAGGGTPAGPGTGGAATESPDPSGASETLPPEYPHAAEVAAAWLGGGSSVGLVTWGSSSCAPIVDGARADGTRITVVLALPESDACTDDLAPRPLLVGTPSGTDVHEDVTIKVTGAVEAEVALPGYTGEAVNPTEMSDGPDAVWTTRDGLLLLETWGSSSCPPVVNEVTAPSDAEIAVTFADPPEGQVCTMDMAPRLTPIWTGDLGKIAGDVELVLNGDTYADVRVPVRS